MDKHLTKMTSGSTRAKRLHKAASVFIRRLGAISLFVLLVGWSHGCRKGPCVHSLALDETMVLKKGELKLSVTLREALQGPLVQVLIIGVRNDGNVRYEGSCVTLWTVSDDGMEFIVAFIPESFDRLSILQTENKKGKAWLDPQATPLALGPGEECELIGHRGPRLYKDDPRPEYIGRLYTEDL